MASYDIYVSFVDDDREFVRRLAADLRREGFSVFYDQADLEGGSLAKSLMSVIKESKYMLAVMSPGYFRSRWVENELNIALKEELETGRVKVIPVLWRECEVPGILGNKHAADFTGGDYEKSFAELAAGLSGPRPAVRPEPGADAPCVGKNVRPLGRSDTDELLTKLRGVVKEFQSGQGAGRGAEGEKVEPDLCFIIMPFGSDELDVVYDYYVRPELEAKGIRCQRGDDIFGSNIIMDDITQSIRRAAVVLADLTTRSPNVFYEVGIAHALDRPVALLAQSIDDVPFDLRHRRVLIYENTPKGCKKLERTVFSHVEAARTAREQ